MTLKNNLPAVFEQYPAFETAYGCEVGALDERWYRDHGVTSAKFVAVYKNTNAQQVILFSTIGIFVIEKKLTSLIRYDEILEVDAYASSLNASFIEHANHEEVKFHADSVLIRFKSGGSIIVFFDGPKDSAEGGPKDAFGIVQLVRIFVKRYS